MQIDRATFTQIIERHQRAVYAVAFAITRDRALADDLTQDTFVVAWCRFDELRDQARLAAWLCGIARNRARDALKRRRAQTDALEIVDHTTPFDALSDARAEQLVATALASVPPVYREPLVLFYLEQQTVEDVAHALGLTPHTTNKRLSRGRQHLAARVEQLVAEKLAHRGPRRDLVPCVLAAIDAPGLHVEPSLAKGSTMLKLAVPAALVMTLGSASLLVADSGSSPRSRNVVPAAKAVPASGPTRKPAPAQTAAATSTTAASTTATPVAAPRAPAAPKLPAVPQVPDCAAVARHLAQLTLDRFTSAKQLPQAKRDQFILSRSHDTTAKCAAQHWSDDRRVCLMSMTDADDTLACAEDGIATADELAALPPELQCDAVARILADLVTAPGAKFDIIAKKMAKAGKAFDLDAMRIQLREQTRQQCDELPWSVTVRRCIVDSRTHADTSACW